LRSFLPEPPKHIGRGKNLDSESFGRWLEVSSIMRHNGFRMPIDRCFEHHFVTRIG
jgi:hypothetical protein